MVLVNIYKHDITRNCEKKINKFYISGIALCLYVVVKICALKSYSMMLYMILCYD